MNITGLQKMTLLDFPGKVACTVFLQGCNYRCPFCHNSELLGSQSSQALSQEALLSFLEKRRGLLDGVCITGGEPTLQKDLPQLIRRIKELGFAVKLDTNGSRPDVLKLLLEEKLLDYVAMDIKNSPARYGETIGIPGFPLDKTEQSIRLLLEGNLPFEFRTTVVEEFHDSRSIEEMGQWLFSLSGGRKIDHYFLQPFVDRDSVLQTGLHSPNPAVLQQFSRLLQPYAKNVCVRGADM